MNLRLFSSLSLSLLLAPVAVYAQMTVVPLPLSGPAYALAQDAYRSSTQGNYRRAIAQLQEAIRLRPDAAILREQLRRIEQEQHRSRTMQSTVHDAGNGEAGIAFSAYQGHDYQRAAEQARRAVDKSPANPAYWLLLGNALVAANRYEDADQVLAEAANRVRDPEAINARRSDVRRELAAREATKVFRAQSDSTTRDDHNDHTDHTGELAAARKAVGYAPDNLSYRLLLILSLLHAEQVDDALTAASEAHTLAPSQSTPLLLRGYVYQRLGQHATAAQDFSAAAVHARAEEQKSTAAFITAYESGTATLPTPTLDCSDPAACRVIAGARPRDRGYAEATLAYQALDDNDKLSAIAHARQAVQLAPKNPDYRRLLLDTLVAANQFPEAEIAASSAIAQSQDGGLLARRGAIRERLGKSVEARADYAEALRYTDLPAATRIDLLARLERRREARQVFADAYAAGAFDQLDKLELAYLASSAGDDATAKTAFDAADRAGKLPPTSYEDAAFTSTRAGDDRSALGYFKRSIDATTDADADADADNNADANGDSNDKSAQQQFDTRRAVSTIDREFGLIASLMRSGGGPSAGSQPGASGNTGTLQAGTEAYWRPFGYHNGKTVEVFARVFQTLQDRSGGSTGTATAQGAVGIRWKPLSNQNVVVSLARLLPLGAQAGSDWLAQLAYSDGIGTDLRVDRPSWWTTQWYAEAGRYVQHPQTYGLASVQTGRSFRLDGIDKHLVAFPHLTLNADYNSLNSRRSAIGFGPGVNLRYWFREDRYHAPRSYVEMSLQYRLKIGGDERAHGVFMTTTLSY